MVFTVRLGGAEKKIGVQEEKPFIKVCKFF